MKAKLLIPLCLLSFSISTVKADGDFLTGDTKLACEAVLCLSSSVGSTISECSPSIKKYFSINAKKVKDTIKKRKNFLKLCPAADEPGMPELVDTLSQLKGHCEADILNKELIEKRDFLISGNSDFGEYETRYRISNKLPDDCKKLNNSQFTDYKLNYSGISEWQKEKDFNKSQKGKWVD